MVGDKVDDLDDEQIAAQAAQRAEEKRKSELRDLGSILDTQAGRRIFRRIIERTGPLRQTFDPQSERLSSLRAGERNVGLWLLAELTEARPDAIGGLIADVQNPSRLDDPAS